MATRAQVWSQAQVVMGKYMITSKCTAVSLKKVPGPVFIPRICLLTAPYTDARTSSGLTVYVPSYTNVQVGRRILFGPRTSSGHKSQCGILGGSPTAITDPNGVAAVHLRAWGMVKTKRMQHFKTWQGPRQGTKLSFKKLDFYKCVCTNKKYLWGKVLEGIFHRIKLKSSWNIQSTSVLLLRVTLTRKLQNSKFHSHWQVTWTIFWGASWPI